MVRIGSRLTSSKHIRWFFLFFIFIPVFGSTVYADYTQQQLYQLGINYYDVSEDSGACSNSGASLTGSDNAEKTWNYLKGQGLDDTHVAAVMGNLQQESSFNPEEIQGGGTTKDPSTVTDPNTGWGIAQWTPGSKVVGIAKQFNITTPIYELATQLNIVWNEMNTGPTPTGMTGFMDRFKATTTLADATQYFTSNFEGPSVVGPRLTDAQNALQRYGGGTSTTQAITNNGSCSFMSPDCTSANGVAKILCAAKAYDTVSYQMGAGHSGAANWHSGCSAIGPNCYLDCSGLVNVAVYDAFGTDLSEDTNSERSDAQHWKQIPFSQLQPGDLVQPNPDHVEIVDHITGNKIYAFAAHTQTVPQPQQVGEWDNQPDINGPGVVYLHYIGPGV